MAKKVTAKKTSVTKSSVTKSSVTKSSVAKTAGKKPAPRRTAKPRAVLPKKKKKNRKDFIAPTIEIFIPGGATTKVREVGTVTDANAKVVCQHGSICAVGRVLTDGEAVLEIHAKVLRKNDTVGSMPSGAKSVAPVAGNMFLFQKTASVNNELDNARSEPPAQAPYSDNRIHVWAKLQTTGWIGPVSKDFNGVTYAGVTDCTGN